MDPDEWSDIFQYTGHVWRRKEFPTKLGGNRRFEAKRLIRVLDLMREERARLDARSTAAAVAAAANGDTTAAGAKAANTTTVESELWVHGCVLEEVKRQVALNCVDHATLIGQVFDQQGAMLQALPGQLRAAEMDAAKSAREIVALTAEKRRLTEMVGPLQERASRFEAATEVAEGRLSLAEHRAALLQSKLKDLEREMKELRGENEVLKADKQEMAERGLLAQETVSWQSKQLDEQARRLSELQAAARKAAAQLETAAATEASLLEESRVQGTREVASQATIASLTGQLEAARAEAAALQERLMGFEAERRKLEARLDQLEREKRSLEAAAEASWAARRAAEKASNVAEANKGAAEEAARREQTMRDAHAAAMALAEENAARLRRSLEMQALEQKELERQLRDKELQLRRAQQAQEDAEAEAAALRAELGPQGENQGYVDEELARLTLTTYCLPTSYLLPTYFLPTAYYLARLKLELDRVKAELEALKLQEQAYTYLTQPDTEPSSIPNPIPNPNPNLTLTLTLTLPRPTSSSRRSTRNKSRRGGKDASARRPSTRRN